MDKDYIFTELGKFHIPNYVKLDIKKYNISKLNVSYNIQRKPLYNNQDYQKYIENIVKKNSGLIKYLNNDLQFSIPKTNKNSELLLNEFREYFLIDIDNYYNFSFYIYTAQINGYHYKNNKKWMIDNYNHNYNKNQKILKFGFDYQRASFSKKPRYDDICSDVLPLYNEFEKIF